MTTVYNERQLEVIALLRRKAELIRALEATKQEIGVAHAKLAGAIAACSPTEMAQINDLGVRNGKA